MSDIHNTTVVKSIITETTKVFSFYFDVENCGNITAFCTGPHLLIY